MLEVKQIHTYYGQSHILFGVSLDLKQGEAVCLLGRNGVGKTTTLKSIVGLTPPKKGEVIYKNINITNRATRKMVGLGIRFVPDDRRIFADLTVKENLAIAQAGLKKPGEWTIEKIYELFPVLKKYNNRRGGFLSGGEQQMLSIARALLGDPELIILDEPTEGLAPLIVRELEEQILKLKNSGISILLAEQNLKTALRLADRCYVLEKGQVCFQGTVDELNENEEVRKKYLLI